MHALLRPARLPDGEYSNDPPFETDAHFYRSKERGGAEVGPQDDRADGSCEWRVRGRGPRSSHVAGFVLRGIFNRECTFTPKESIRFKVSRLKHSPRGPSGSHPPRREGIAAVRLQRLLPGRQLKLVLQYIAYTMFSF